MVTINANGSNRSINFPTAQGVTMAPKLPQAHKVPVSRPEIFIRLSANAYVAGIAEASETPKPNIPIQIPTNCLENKIRIPKLSSALSIFDRMIQEGLARAAIGMAINLPTVNANQKRDVISEAVDMLAWSLTIR